MTSAVMPVIALLPTLTARLAGSAGWLSPIAAIPVLVLASWIAKGEPGRKERSPWKTGESIIIILYLLWIPLTLAVALRLSSARLERIYGAPAGAICAAALLVIALWIGWGKVSALGRAGEIFYLALSVLTAGILLLALFRVDWSSFSIGREELVGLPMSSLASAGLLLNVYPAVVLNVKIPQQGTNKRTKILWIMAFCVSAALLLAVVTGCLGARLTEQIPAPFYVMLQGLGIKGAFQRMEAPVAALLTLSDITLIGLLLHAWREWGSRLCPGKWSQVAIVPVSAASMTGGMIFFADATALWEFSSTVLPVIGLTLGLLCPAVMRFIAVVLGKRQKR